MPNAENVKKYTFTFPPLYGVNRKLNKNYIKYLIEPEVNKVVSVTKFSEKKTIGFIIRSEDSEEVLVVCNGSKSFPNRFNKVLRFKGNRNSKDIDDLIDNTIEKVWVCHPKMNQVPFDKCTELSDAIHVSWENQFCFRSEVKENKVIIRKGLRSPQIGAIHATFAHWCVSKDPATIVMPTGTGKTETMLSILVGARCKKVLVIVPTDALRGQISQKFVSLGILKQFGIISAETLYPVVGILKHRLKSIEEVHDFFSKCNVVVATMSIIAACESGIQNKIAEVCSDIFIDEAHHIAARTWKSFKEKCSSNRIIQFTATPFRNDSKHVDGKIIFNYPLSKAQKEGYFKKINFVPVFEFDDDQADQVIAEKAIEQLRLDQRKNYNHILMARVEDIKKAEKIRPLYEKYREFNPLVIHSKCTAKERREILQKVKDKQCKIIICVDMLGEGFDLPELKIAAMHDVHKSLGITLQFTGRFTRTKETIGEATLIANLANLKVKNSLDALYGENADWNLILRNKSSQETKKQIETFKLLEGFTETPSQLSIRNIKPALSTVVYKMPKNTTWTPSRFRKAIGKDIEIVDSLNKKENILLFVTRKKEPVKWGTIKEITNIVWDLYIVFWDKKQQLLFINGSSGGRHQKLAEAIGGTEVLLIAGETIFKCFSEVKRVTLHNVGLNYALQGPLRYMMYTGVDVSKGLTLAHQRKTVKSNFFGLGYENGEKTTIGCSYKGKIWAKKVVSIVDWKNWCVEVGKKLLDSNIKVEEMLEGVLKPTEITERPKKIPIAIEWPFTFLMELYSQIQVNFNDELVSFYDLDIKLKDYSDTGPLKFVISSDNNSAEFELQITEQGAKYICSSEGISLNIQGKEFPITEKFLEEPPVIRFVDGSFIENNIHVQVKDEASKIYDVRKIKVLPWSGVDITKESQGKNKRTDSIQYYLIQELKKNNYSIIFDDDNAGEAADIITVNLDDENKSILIELYHCKYSHAGKSGSRINDLYEVCGQAIKSVRWRECLDILIDHMQRREVKREKNGEISRFERGDKKQLTLIQKKLKYYDFNLNMFIVQPGLSKSSISKPQMEVLGATELYLQETYNINLTIIGST